MPRNMSFALTKKQYRNRTKDITRRLGWAFLEKGERFNGCEKCQGLRKGEKIIKMGLNRTVSTRWEPLQRMIDDPEYGKQEVIREGFPEMTPEQFVTFFCDTHKGCTSDTPVNRIEFEYLDRKEAEKWTKR